MCYQWQDIVLLYIHREWHSFHSKDIMMLIYWMISTLFAPSVKCWRHGCNHVVFNVKLGHAALILNRLLRLCLCLCLCSEFAKSLIETLRFLTFRFTHTQTSALASNRSCWQKHKRVHYKIMEIEAKTILNVKTFLMFV